MLDKNTVLDNNKMESQIFHEITLQPVQYKAKKLSYEKIQKTNFSVSQFLQRTELSRNDLTNEKNVANIKLSVITY